MLDGHRMRDHYHLTHACVSSTLCHNLTLIGYIPVDGRVRPRMLGLLIVRYRTLGRVGGMRLLAGEAGPR